MGNIKKFSEYISEELKKSAGDIKADELWSASDGDSNKFKTLMYNQLKKIGNVDEFISYFKSCLTDEICELMRDGKKLDMLDFLMDNDEKYGEYGFSVVHDERDFYVFAFCGNYDSDEFAETELGKKMLSACSEALDDAEEIIQKEEDEYDSWESTKSWLDVHYR